MTAVSEHDCARSGDSHANRTESPRSPRVARTLHAALAVVLRATLVVAACSAVGCVLPPSLSVGGDAGVDSPPAITSVRSNDQELAQPGPVFFDEGAGAGTLDLTLLDTDIGDTLYVRIFVGYNDPILGATPGVPAFTAPRSECVGAQSNTAVRSTECDLTGLCLPEDVNATRSMLIVVFDRQPLSSGDPPYMATTGGESTSRFYYLQCQQQGT